MKFSDFFKRSILPNISTDIIFKDSNDGSQSKDTAGRTSVPKNVTEYNMEEEVVNGVNEPNRNEDNPIDESARLGELIYI